MSDPRPIPATLEPIFRYWDQKRGDRRMPRRADIDPFEMVPYLPNLMIVDVVADERRFVYRLVGTREVEARGRDPTGKPVGDAFHGSSRENVLAHYDRVVDSRRPYFDTATVIRTDERVDETHVIFLPLSEDDVSVSQILVYTRFETSPHDW
jgi:hypothetical protein